MKEKELADSCMNYANMMIKKLIELSSTENLLLHELTLPLIEQARQIEQKLTRISKHYKGKK